MILRTVVGMAAGAVGGVIIGGGVFLARHLIRPFSFVGWGNLGWMSPLLLAALGMPLPGAVVGAAVGVSGAGAAYGAVVGAALGAAYIVAANFRGEAVFRDKGFWDVLTTFALTHGLVGAAVAACLGGLFSHR
ncbi:MAG TPA: hypothetical protein VF508_13965 [Pyrinomonadaceae bacterium]|jgi:hypothetical protein